MFKSFMKNENKVLIILAFFSIGVGLWGNFRQLWLQSNHLDVTQISNILSIASFISAICIFICSLKIQMNKIKNFISFTLFLKVFVMFLLFIINGLADNVIIRLLIILDIVLEKFIILSIYPLIICIKKEDSLYSKRKLIEYLCRDIGILIGGLFIGKTIFSLTVDYNFCLLLSLLFLSISSIIMFFIKIETNTSKSKISFYYIFKDKISFIYLIYYFIGTVAMSIGLGLKMLMLTNKLGFSDNGATNYFLLIGLIADVIGIIILKFLTQKNDYTSLTIKFGIRLFLYILAFIINDYMIILISITWSILISTAYENKTDAPYINRVKNECQLFYSNIRYMIGMLAESFGLFLGGIMYAYGVNYMLGLSSLFIAFQLLLAYYLIYLRQKENKQLEESI